MLAYSVNAKLIGVNTLQAIAANICIAGTVTEGQMITAAVDAQRGEVSAQTFRLTPSRFFAGELYPEPMDERHLLTFAAWWQLAKDDTTLWFAGPILQKIATRKPENVRLLDESLWQPNAAGVARLAWERLYTGESDDLLTLQPYYSRPSAAEERMPVVKSE
jgi:tRNA A37 threonylcarbamoyladenosine modification protein TsaB